MDHLVKAKQGAQKELHSKSAIAHALIDIAISLRILSGRSEKKEEK